MWVRSDLPRKHVVAQALHPGSNDLQKTFALLSAGRSRIAMATMSARFGKCFVDRHRRRAQHFIAAKLRFRERHSVWLSLRQVDKVRSNTKEDRRLQLAGMSHATELGLTRFPKLFVDQIPVSCAQNQRLGIAVADSLNGVTKRRTISTMTVEDEQLAEDMLHHRCDDIL